MIQAYIGLGSNLQEPLQQLRHALRAIGEAARFPPGAGVLRLPQCRRRSRGATRLSQRGGAARNHAGTRGAAARRCRASNGRRAGSGPSAGGRVPWTWISCFTATCSLATPTLTIPHPALALRNFVLYPLLEICGPNLLLPDGEDLGTLIARCPQGDLVKTRLRLTGDALVPGDTN